MSTHPKQYNRLLLPEPPLQVLPSLAVLIGLNEAIFLQQLHYWLQKSGKARDGQVWIYNTYAEWQQQLPFWSNATLRRIIGNLEEKKLIIGTDRFNQSKIDRTKWYAIDYQALDRLLESTDDLLKMSSSTDQDEQVEEVNLSKSVPETNQETNGRERRHMTIEEIEEAERRHQEIERWTHPEKYRDRKSR